MANLAAAFPLLPGKLDAFNAFTEEMRGPRKAEYEQSRKRLGITTERAFYQPSPHGDMVVIYLEGEDPVGFFGKLAASTEPFDVWFKERVADLHGVDVTQPPPGPMAELAFDYHK